MNVEATKLGGAPNILAQMILLRDALKWNDVQVCCHDHTPQIWSTGVGLQLEGAEGPKLQAGT